MKPYRATQYDLSVEYYTGPGGSISAALFAKDVSDFISSQTTTGTIPGVLRLDGGSTFLITQPVNGGSATIKGFELAVQQPFSFLPSPFDGFGIIANYTYSDAKAASGSTLPAAFETLVQPDRLL